MIDLDEIEAVAKAATPGEWKRLERWDGRVVVQKGSGGASIGHLLTEDDAAHIAAMSPATTLTLIAELREARVALASAERASKIEIGITRTDIGNAMLSELRRALARHAKGAL